MSMTTKKRLYRNSGEGKIAGVCAGIADYFGIETWLVRILTITAFLLVTGPFTIIGYVVLWAVLDKKSDLLANGEGDFQGYTGSTSDGQSSRSGRYGSQSRSDSKVEVKDSVWKAGQSPKVAFQQIQQKYNRTENRLRKLEGYVTSNEFQLNRELNKL